MEDNRLTGKGVMMMSRRFSILLFMTLAAVLIASPAVMGQSKDSEMSIEESYLQETIELMIIRETARSTSREQKLIALEYIGSALERGSTNDELRTTLEYLSLDGTLNKTREGKAGVVNDYPDVRRQAVKYLGSIETKESKDALIKVCTSDNEPMVLQEAVRSLGIIGLNDDDDAINAVVWVTYRNSNSKVPDSLLAIAAMDTLDKLSEKYKTMEPSTIQLLARIAEGPYNAAVKEKAKYVLGNIRNYR